MKRFLFPILIAVVVLTMKDFDRNFYNLKAFRIQYKQQGGNWTDLHEYVLDGAQLSTNQQLLPDSMNIVYRLSMLINSQGAVVVAMLPLAYSLGIPGPVLLGVLPAVYGYFFIPNYPSDIATVSFDRSGTTKIGKYLLNHSFMMPGLVSVTISTVVAYLLSWIIF